jgi:spore maturation protein CgeB
MKILLIQENGRHDVNRNYRECFCLQRAFISHNHLCDVWGLGHTNYNTIPDYESYDWIINLENYDESNWVPNISNVKNPKKFLWSIDAHCRGEDIYEQTFTLGKYDYLLHSTKNFVKKPYHIWFPNSFDNLLIKKLDVPKQYDIGFCGNYVNRKSVLEWLQQSFGLHLDIFVIGDEMVKTVNSYKCQFNLNISNDINYRSFETIGCGTILLTNYNPQYIELGFKDNVNCLMYKDTSELIDKIQYVKNNDLLDISSRGYELSKKHSYIERLNLLFSI